MTIDKIVEAKAKAKAKLIYNLKLEAATHPNLT